MLAAASATASGYSINLAQAQERKPNVVFMLADNVDYGDLGPYGVGELRVAPTPRIDQLAAEGLRLTQCGAIANMVGALRPCPAGLQWSLDVD